MALFTATSARRRQIMTVLLALAVAGAVVRLFAPNPSTLRDVGTLLLVLWLPVVGNLVAWVIGKFPRKPPPGLDFAPGSDFLPHLQAQVDMLDVPAAIRLDAAERRCLLVVARRGFIARLRAPVTQAVQAGGSQMLEIELLHPTMALRQLAPGADFHLLAANTAVASGRVVAVLPAAAGA